MRDQTDVKECLLPSELSECGCEGWAKIFLYSIPALFSIAWMGSNWAQTICGASWMCYLAAGFFSFLFLLLFSVLFYRKVMAQQWSVLSGFTRLQTAPLSFVCARAKSVRLNEYELNVLCVCLHACVCMGMFVLCPPPMSHPAPTQPPPSLSLLFLVPRCFNQ